MKYLVFFLLLSAPLASFSQERLNMLVDERQSLHRQWKQSESKKSGIFGNRTKKDMVETNDWMERIISKDNQIMEELERMRNIERTEITYEKDDYKYISQKQEQDIGRLKRALAAQENEINEKKSNNRTYEWLAFIFFLSTVTLGILFYKKVK